MAISFQASTQGLTPGADLWIICDKLDSKWLRRLDWLTNLQIFKNKHHQQKKISRDLEKIILNTEVLSSLPGMNSNANSFLMISTEKYLPNRWLVLVEDFFDDRIEKMISDLKCTHVRFFLHSGLTSEEFSQVWSQRLNESNLQLISEL